MIDHPQLVTNLNTLQRCLHPPILSHNVFVPSLLEVCAKICENAVPPVAISKQSREISPRPALEKPRGLTKEAITPYLLGLRMNGTLSLHDWDKRVKEYADQNPWAPGTHRIIQLAKRQACTLHLWPPYFGQTIPRSQGYRGQNRRCDSWKLSVSLCILVEWSPNIGGGNRDSDYSSLNTLFTL